MKAKGKLIVIESGTDSSGKATQTERLFKRLSKEGYEVRKVEYPNYSSDSSVLIKMYLKGEFGRNPQDVNPYVASTFYAVDRFASFKREWKDFYDDGGIIIADRYTTSNMVHQAAKIDDMEEKDRYLDWLWDLEFNKFGLPVPSCVIFLDMPPNESIRLMKNRSNKFTGQKEKDIHEKDFQYMIKSYRNACFIAEKYDWFKIDCVNNGILKSIEDIHDEIYKQVIKIVSWE